MALIHINHPTRVVAVGLDWHLLPGMTSERKEVAALVKQHGSKVGCVVGSDESGVSVLGLAPGHKPGVACGAAWLAKALAKASAGASVILVEPIEGDRLWLCAVRAGLPVQGLDIVINASDLHQRLQDFLRDSQEPRICSTLEHLDDFGYANVSPESFAELVANTKPEKLVRVAGVPPALVAAGVAGTLLVTAYLGGTAYLDGQAAKRAAQLRAEKARIQKLEASEAARKLQAAHRDAAIALLRKGVLEQPEPSAAVAAIFSAIEVTPTSVSGWTLTGLDCTPSNCILSWARTRVGTVAGFLQDAEARGWSVRQAAGDQAAIDVPVSATARALTVDDLVEAPVFRVALESRLQELQLMGYRYEMPPLQPIEASLPKDKAAAPVAPAASAPSQPLPWQVGVATVKGARLFALREVPQHLDHPGVAFKSAKADLKSNEWILEMTYATR